jgi:hypothetical protein
MADQGAMKITSALALAAAVPLVLATTLNAGTVQVGLLSDSDYQKWRCDPSMAPAKPPVESRCPNAKFRECSSCDTVVVTNNSDAPVDVKIDVSGAGFSQRAESAQFFQPRERCDGPNGGEERPMSNSPSCGLLPPATSCKEAIDFCPEQSGTSHGRVRVITSEGGRPQIANLELIGDGIYTPELQAADEARRRHLDELMKIPQVTRVELDPSGADIFIDLRVEGGASLDEVRRAAPAKIEDYQVEVTR